MTLTKHYPLNLHLFDNTQTTGTNATGNSLSAEMKTYYHDRLIDNAEPELVYDQFGDKYPIPRNGGKTIEFRKFDPLPKALTPLTEGVTPSGNKLNVSTITAEVAQYGDYIEMSDVLETTAIDHVVEEATSILGGQQGRTIDTVVRDIVTAGTNKIFAPKLGENDAETAVLLRKDITTACRFTPKLTRLAVAKLRRMNAKPYDGKYFTAIIHPDVACDYQNEKGWEEAHKYTDAESIYQGEIGRMGGCRFIESTEAKIIGPSVISDGKCRLSVKTAISASTTSVVINEVLTSNASCAIDVYINGVANKITAITTTNGTTTLTVETAITSLSAGAMICGQGAGKDGSAIYCTMIIGKNAYGTTDVSGLGTEFILKQLGSSGTSDPLNQRSTVGWKATKTAERLVEAYMVRVEHSSPSFGASAESN